jgi:hypothetical protein
MIRYFLLGMLCLSTSPILCQEIDYRNTKACVTYEMASIWLDPPMGAGPSERATLTIKGEINTDAVTMVKKYYEKITKNMEPDLALCAVGLCGAIAIVVVELDSLGGDVDAAIEIGRFFRAKDAGVEMHVPRQARCASACLLILAGGTNRRVEGNLGIHRPFLAAPLRSTTTENVKNAATKTQERLRAYFREMNISERLADDMMMIPTDQMRWLTSQEISVYGLGVEDPVTKETGLLKEAQKYGLSRMDYEARVRRARTLCKSGDPPDCSEKIMRGVQP